jgi:hypothetical protein
VRVGQWGSDDPENEIRRALDRVGKKKAGFLLILTRGGRIILKREASHGVSVPRPPSA